MKKVVTVFGSSIPREGDEEYEIAFRIGNIFGRNGLDVCTGGYGGIMDAVSKGAVAVGGKAIGVTVDIFNAVPSTYLTEEIQCHTLFERIEKFVSLGDAYVILNGGTGTMLELSVVWEMFNKGLTEEKPVAAHGELWNEIVTAMEKRIVIEKRKTGLIRCYNRIEDVAEYIIQALE